MFENTPMLFWNDTCEKTKIFVTAYFDTFYHNSLRKLNKIILHSSDRPIKVVLVESHCIRKWIIPN